MLNSILLNVLAPSSAPARKPCAEQHWPRLGLWFKSILIWASLTLLCAAQAQQALSPQVVEAELAGLRGRIEVLGDLFKQPPGLGKDQSRIVMYRTGEDALPGATSVFVNGEYHASLVRGGYSDICLSPGNMELGTRQMKAGARPKDPYDAFSVVQLMPGQTHYIKVHEARNLPLMRLVPETQALQELEALRFQSHTISRVDAAQTCRFVPQPVTRDIMISADALFHFDRFAHDAMLPEGRRSLDLLLERLRTERIQVKSIHVTGHADPLGSDAHNEQLGISRARTVREYLQVNGLQDVPITSEGMGSRQPAVTHCGRAPTPEAVRCHQPNRRVVLTITGIAPLK